MRLIQFMQGGARHVGAIVAGGTEPCVVRDATHVRELALEAHRAGCGLAELVRAKGLGDPVDYDELIREKRLLPPIDHPDPARMCLSLTGLTHLGSARSRDSMHAKLTTDDLTDSMKMFKLGLEGGRPAPGDVGVQPEWAWKGDGSWVVPPEHALERPAYAEDGGEEAEVAGLYVIGDDGTVLRVGFALGNEFSDHVMERRNYLYLAHSKLRQCSFGPELLVGALPSEVVGTVRIVRGDSEVWRGEFLSGEANMCHSIANLECHHFKYANFRRPGDVHVHFLGASALSCSQGVVTRTGDRFEIHCEAFGRPLRNEMTTTPMGNVEFVSL